MKYFGHKAFAPIDGEGAPTPTGASCPHCFELIGPDDDGFIVPGLPLTCDNNADGNAFHRACFLRGITGSVAHQRKECSCFVPGSTCGDDPALSAREAAEAALKEYTRV